MKVLMPPIMLGSLLCIRDIPAKSFCLYSSYAAAFGVVYVMFSSHFTFVVILNKCMTLPLLGGESRVPEQASSPEYRALGQASNLIVNSIDPNDIVALLFDNQLLTRYERDLANTRHLIPQQRMGKVYSALEKRVRVSSKAFHKFVPILIGMPAYKPVAKQLYDLYLKEGGTRQEYAAQFEAPTPGIVTSASIYTPIASYIPSLLQCSTVYGA